MAKTKADYMAEAEALRLDLAIIGARLKKEALDRDWCETYDEVMNEINAQTSEPHMVPCSQQRTVWVEGVVTLKVSGSVDILVENGVVLGDDLRDEVLAMTGFRSGGNDWVDNREVTFVAVQDQANEQSVEVSG